MVTQTYFSNESWSFFSTDQVEAQRANEILRPMPLRYAQGHGPQDDGSKNTSTRHFSIIIPTFNRRLFLEKAVISILGQTFNNFELIVIDDGGSDGTDKLMSSFKDKRITYIYQKNQGVARARNIGIKLSKGTYIAFLDSDDFWKPEKLEKTVQYIEKFPDIKIFHTEEVWFRKGILLPQKKKHKKPTGFVYKQSLALCCISISTAVVKKDVFSSIGMFDETMEACEDYDFWLRAANKYEVKLIPETLTIKDGGRPDQLSSKIWGLDRFRINALKKMLCSKELKDRDYQETLKEFKKKCAIFAAGAKKRGRIKEAEFYYTLSSEFNLVKS